MNSPTSPSASGARVVYIVYWGASEPLGQSLVIPPVVRLAQKGVRLTLVTFEKVSDLARLDEMARIRRKLADHGVSWVPLRYHKRPKWPATGADVLHGCLRALLCRVRGPVDIVHARTFVGGPMGFLAARLLGARFIYHNEGFYPDEQVDGGVWKQGSLPHRVARAVERTLYERADGVIVLSHRAREQIAGLGGVARRRVPVVVVPSTVDLERFQPPRAPLAPYPIRLIYIGSVGARYILDAVGRFVSVLSRHAPGLHLRVLTPASADLVDRMLRTGGLSRESWDVGFVPHAAVPEELVRCHAGLFFLTRGLSEHACSPTKIGEYWACGLPVVTTPNVSDTDAIVESERVGVVLREDAVPAYDHAARQFLELLRDPDLGRRCRQAAESHYALEPACERQAELYRQLLEGDPKTNRAPTARPA